MHGEFDEDARCELIRRTRRPRITPRTRDRLEMLRLSDAGWSIPRIAEHMHQHEQTVRRWVKVFLLDGFDALVDPPRPGKPSAITSDIVAEVRQWIEKGDRIWTAGQIAEEVARKKAQLQDLQKKGSPQRSTFASKMKPALR